MDARGFMIANEQDRRGPTSGCTVEDHVSHFRYIPGWDTMGLACAHCGTKLSVKYRLSDGRTVCNLCVTNSVLDRNDPPNTDT